MLFFPHFLFTCHTFSNTVLKTTAVATLNLLEMARSARDKLLKIQDKIFWSLHTWEWSLPLSMPSTRSHLPWFQFKKTSQNNKTQNPPLLKKHQNTLKEQTNKQPNKKKTQNQHKKMIILLVIYRNFTAFSLTSLSPLTTVSVLEISCDRRNMK